MPKFDADKLFEDIEVSLGGKDYKIERITEEALEELQKLASGDQPLPDGVTVLDAQLACVLNVPAADMKKVDVRKKTRVIKWLTKTIGDQLSGKDELGNVAGNAPQESV